MWLSVHGVWVGRGQQVDSGLRRAAGSGRGRCYCFLGVGGIAGRRYRAGCAVRVACRVVFGGVGASCGGGNAAFDDRFEIASFGAGWVGAAGLCLSVGASGEGGYCRVLASRFDMAKSPPVIKLLRGGGRIGSFDYVAATKDKDSGEVRLELTVFCGDLYDNREGLLIVELGVPIGVVEAGFGNEN